MCSGTGTAQASRPQAGPALLLHPRRSCDGSHRGRADSPGQQEALRLRAISDLPNVTEVARAEPGPTLSFCSGKLSDMGNVSKRLWTQVPRVYLRTTRMEFWRRWDPATQLSATEGKEAGRGKGMEDS